MVKIKNFRSSNGGNDKILLILAVIVALVSFVAFVVSYWTVGITGYATSNQSTGVVNVTIVSNLIINFTNNTVRWGNGYLTPGAIAGSAACLDTSIGQTPTTSAYVTGPTGARTGISPSLCVAASWDRASGAGADGKSGGLILQNIGNVPASIYLKSDKAYNDITFIGGTNPVYAYNVSRIPGNLSCEPPVGFNIATWYDVNSSVVGLGTKICNRLDDFAGNGGIPNATIRVDIRLEVPFDAPPSIASTGGSIIMATAETAT